MRTLRVLPSRGGGDRVEALRRAMVGSMRFGNGPGKRDANDAKLPQQHGNERERENELAAEAEATRIANANAALIVAATRGDINSVRQQLATGAEANVKNAHGTPVLMLASERGYTEIVNVLLAEGADANAPDRFGWTALMAASNYPATTKALLDGGADPNAMRDNGVRYECALYDAITVGEDDGDGIEAGNVETVKILLAYGADPNIRMGGGHPTWTYALIDGNVAITIALLRGGAEPHWIYTGHPTFDEAVRQLGDIDGVKNAHVEWLRALPISSPAIKPSWIVTLPATDPTRKSYELWLKENAPRTDALAAEYERLRMALPGSRTKAAGRR